MRVRDIMSQPPQICHLGTNLALASRRMRDTGCGTLAVLDPRGRLAGMLTDRDLALALSDLQGDPAHATIAHYMTAPVHTARPDDDLHDVLFQMTRWKVRRLPVVDTDGDLKGMISVDDVVLWGVQEGGVGLHEVTQALRTIVGAHRPALEADAS